MILQEGTGVSSGKIILLGEHAVVYGEPAIAFPLSQLQVTAEVQPQITNEQLIQTSLYEGNWQEMPNHLRGLRVLLESLVHHFALENQGFLLKIDSQLPQARGMGSSAAVAVATVRAFFAANQTVLGQETLLQFANISEKIYHGNPSGIDLMTTSSKHPVYFQKKQIPKFFESHLDARLVIADTGQVGQTFKAVADVKDYVDEHPVKGPQVVQQIGAYVKRGMTALSNNEVPIFGDLMNQVQHNLKLLGASNEKIEALISAALVAGALGAKLTGSGQGGCVIALAKDDEQSEIIKEAMLQAGANKVWLQSLSIS